MNEVTQIHLGRQAFTISVDAQKELRKYLDDIKKQIADQEVIDEVELRMAELLAEHGITGEKVVLPGDVLWLKQQLGEPQDFKEDSESSPKAGKQATGKRLFRDTDNAVLAGVAAGVANYFGIDVLLVRILFVLSVITGGWGILVYIVMWLLVPEAKSSSDRLRMAGQPVTVDSLKEIVERADVKGAAHRAQHSLAGPINSIFRVVLKVAGLAVVTIGLALLFAFIALESYIVIHGGNLFGQDIFPVGFREHLLLNLGAAMAALLALLVIILGIALFKQKWPIKTWATGTLVGLILIGLAGTIALSADVAPQVRDRYDAHLHTSVRHLSPFTTYTIKGDGISVRDEIGGTYSVKLNYFDNPNLANIKTTVVNGTLVIDATGFDEHRHCESLCIPDTYDVTMTVDSPVPLAFPAPEQPVKPPDGSILYQP